MAEMCHRRTALRPGGASILTAAMRPRFSFSQTGPPKVRVGVFGGNFRRSFYFHEHPDCVVETVSDLRPERRKALMEACFLRIAGVPARALCLKIAFEAEARVGRVEIEHDGGQIR